MKTQKKLIALVIVLALAVSVPAFALADTSTDTDGTIKFRSGDISIITPGDGCCDCYGGPPVNDCDCPCHIFLPDPSVYKYGGTLDFGSWIVGDFGIYGSRTDGLGGKTHTGIYAANQTTEYLKVSVSVTPFVFNNLNSDEFAGVYFSLFADKSQVIDGSSVVAHNDTGDMTPGNDYLVLVTNPGSLAAANWYGKLDVPAGTAKFAGEAKAILTWTIPDTP